MGDSYGRFKNFDAKLQELPAPKVWILHVESTLVH
jgi:hypothetical protein